MTPRPPVPSGELETGAALVTVTVTMVALLAFAALAVDAAAAWSQRRENQGAVDTAVIAGAQFTVGVDAATGMEDAENEVMRITYASIQPTITEPEWEALWASCTDPGKPASYNQTHTSDCVSFNNDLTKMRVMLPEVPVPTAFGWILGANYIPTAAAAEVDIGTGSSGTAIPAIFAAGQECRAFGMEQITFNGSNNTVYGGIHSNDNIDVSGSNNDFGDGDPGLDPFTYVSSINQGGSGNDYDTGYPALAGVQGWPLTKNLADYDTGGVHATAAGANYYRRTGDIDGDYIESRGDGLYYATGNITLDKSLDADVTLVAEGEIEISGSNQSLEPYLDNLLAFAGKENVGSERCDLFTLSMSGSANSWTGLIYAPGGLIEMAGSSNSSVTGALLGNAVMLNGSTLTIQIDPNLTGASDDPVFSLSR